MSHFKQDAPRHWRNAVCTHPQDWTIRGFLYEESWTNVYVCLYHTWTEFHVTSPSINTQYEVKCHCHCVTGINSTVVRDTEMHLSSGNLHCSPFSHKQQKLITWPTLAAKGVFRTSSTQGGGKFETWKWTHSSQLSARHRCLKLDAHICYRPTSDKSRIQNQTIPIVYWFAHGIDIQMVPYLTATMSIISNIHANNFQLPKRQAGYTERNSENEECVRWMVATMHFRMFYRSVSHL
jgi:hypothetical protein